MNAQTTTAITAHMDVYTRNGGSGGCGEGDGKGPPEGSPPGPPQRGTSRIGWMETAVHDP